MLGSFVGFLSFLWVYFFDRVFGGGEEATVQGRMGLWEGAGSFLTAPYVDTCQTLLHCGKWWGAMHRWPL